MAKIALGIDHLSVLGMPPVSFVELAAKIGCSSVSLFAEPIAANPYGFPRWSLLSDAALRREVRERMEALGITLALGEGCAIAPGVDVARCVPIIDMFREIGAQCLNLISFEPDLARDYDQTCRFAELAVARDVAVCLEFSARAGRPKLNEFIARIERTGQNNLSALIDVMHFFRAGQSAADLRCFDPRHFTHLQLCDAPMAGTADYMDEALHRRLIPGEGEMPVSALIAALPADIAISMEIPQVDRVQSGMSQLDRLRHAAAQCRTVIERARGGRA